MFSSGNSPVVRKLFWLSAFCFVLEFFRLVTTQTLSYIFLPWNLILAWVPLGFALLPFENYTPLKRLGVIVAWLLFFPNAPYIITDLIHLRPRGTFPLWYDAILVYSFAFTGLFVGMMSALIVYRKLQTFISVWVSKGLLLFAMLLSGYGIYIGRFLRWNSWDILFDPIQILAATGQRLINPMDYPRTYGVTLVVGVMVSLVFLLFDEIAKQHRTEKPND
jgi:uncharacterized membrane protein